MPYYVENLRSVNNAHNKVLATHLDAGSVLTTAMTLISGTDITDYDKISTTLHNTHGSAAINFQVWGSNVSGTTAPTDAVSGGITWAPIGDPVTVAAGNASVAAWETSRTKFIAVTGSASANIASGCHVHVFAISRQ